MEREIEQAFKHLQSAKKKAKEIFLDIIKQHTYRDEKEWSEYVRSLEMYNSKPGKYVEKIIQKNTQERLEGRERRRKQ